MSGGGRSVLYVCLMLSVVCWELRSIASHESELTQIGEGLSRCQREARSFMVGLRLVSGLAYQRYCE